MTRRLAIVSRCEPLSIVAAPRSGGTAGLLLIAAALRLVREAVQPIGARPWSAHGAMSPFVIPLSSRDEEAGYVQARTAGRGAAPLRPARRLAS